MLNKLVISLNEKKNDALGLPSSSFFLLLFSLLVFGFWVSLRFPFSSHSFGRSLSKQADFVSKDVPDTDGSSSKMVILYYISLYIASGIPFN